MSPLAGIRIALVVFVVAILQVSAFSGFTVGRGGPDVLLVALVSIALLRGSVTGAIAGFARRAHRRRRHAWGRSA